MNKKKVDKCLDKWASLNSASANYFSIILMLNTKETPMTQTELVETYGLNQAAVSKTLAKLVNENISDQTKIGGEKAYALTDEFSCVFEKDIEDEINKLIKIIRLLKANDYRIIFALMAQSLREDEGYTQTQMVKKFSWKSSSVSLAVNRLSQMEIITPNLPKSFKQFIYKPNWTRYESYVQGE